LYESYEKKYFPIIEKLNYNEESRIYFLKCHFEKLAKIIEDYTIGTYDFLNVMILLFYSYLFIFYLFTYFTFFRDLINLT